MAHPLYMVITFICATIMLIFLYQFRVIFDKSEKTDKDFLFLACWTTMFCIQDGFWGFFGCGIIINHSLYFISTSIFHALAAFSAYIWLSYILNFIGLKKEFAIPAKLLSLALVLFQLIIISINFKTKFIFDIASDNTYIAHPGRSLLYYSQYLTFFIVGVLTAFKACGATLNTKRKHIASLIFLFAPILCGFLQKLFPLVPCDSIGYTLGCCTIYAFYISKICRNRDLSQKAVIIAGLSADYDLVVYINTAKNKAKYYQVSEKFAPLLWEGRNSSSPQSFDDFMRRIFVPNEFSGFIEKSTLEKCTEILQSAPYYTIPFLAKVDDSTEHYRLKIASDKSDPHAFTIGIINVEMEHRLEETASRLRKDLQYTKQIANKDPLTGVGSAAAFKAKCELMDSEIKAKDKIRFAIIECDVNDLKVINDSFGHDMGDEYLKNCSKVFCNIFNHSPVYRIGGDEFVIILFGEQYDARSELFEKLKASENRKPNSPKESISFATGMADYSAQIDECVKDVLKRADTFMYIDKTKMKNKR